MAIRDKNDKLHSESNGRFVSKDDKNYSDSVNERIKWAKDNDIELPLNADGSVDDIALQKLQSEKKHVKNKTQAEFFGEEFTGVKGSDAIEKLLKEKRGHVKNAFTRPEIGGIDLVWGDDTGGLQHTIMRRDKMLRNGTGNISGLDMVKKIPYIIEKGDFDLDENDRPGIEKDGYRVAIRPTYDGKKLNWIVTAMEITSLKNSR